MIRSERGDPCKHPVRPPIPNTCCWIRGRRAFESGNVEVVDKGIRGVFPVEDADDAAEGELVVGEEEAQAVDTLPTPYQPTQSERDDHELTHANYRSWCEHCVNGRGLEMKHAATTQEGRGIAIVGFDYMFISGSSGVRRMMGMLMLVMFLKFLWCATLRARRCLLTPFDAKVPMLRVLLSSV